VETDVAKEQNIGLFGS